MSVRIFLRALLAAPLLSGLAACGGGAPERGPVVLAASSLQESLSEAAAAWTAQGHAAPVLSFGASSALARQVDSGAPADLFLSADEEWMDTLEAAGRLRPGMRVLLLSNRLVLVRRAGAAERSLDDLGGERLALADPKAVPAGKYAQAALASLGQWDAVADQVVPAENVRAALALVERGEAPLGIVYATDARASRGVEVVSVYPEASHPPIRYPAAVLEGSGHREAAAFLAFLGSAEGRAIFRRHGFGTPE